MSSTVSDGAPVSPHVKRDWRLLHVDDAGSRTYESKGPDHEAMLIVASDGQRALYEIAMCGHCLGERCEYHPGGPQADVFGPTYPSDLWAERQVSTPVVEPEPDLVSPERGQHRAAAVEPKRRPVELKPPVDPVVEQGAKVIAEVSRPDIVSLRPHGNFSCTSHPSRPGNTLRSA